jgi:eukaryotic-like serine/threonine-protein kinase
MTLEEWRRAKEIFDVAWELEPRARESYLAAACRGEESVRAEVERMLLALARNEDFLEEPLLFDAALLPAGEQAGRLVGRYRLVRELGRGGMGSVYLAVRADEIYNQEVAVKLVWPGPDAAGVEQRFWQERRILAALNHPNIARLLDGGATEDGQPYLVMEYVAGVPITPYCEEHKLSIAERLKLFRSVCAAVAHAHQHLVIHRDLKPSNIHVTEDGLVKLLDFGIAKLLTPETGGASVPLTRTGAHMLTPEYASPEQTRDEEVTTASDVYSLGVLLYELLTGHRPYQFKSPSIGEIARVICEEEPDRPSANVGPADQILSRILKGDLDQITLKALRKDPGHRYQSVVQLSDDIQRHLSGEPVSARESTFGYRVSKYVRRHKVRVIVASLALLLVFGAVIFFARQANLARAQARAQRRLLYAADMRQAGQDLADGNLNRVREMVERYSPGANSNDNDDWRGFEWYFLWNALDTGKETLPHPGYKFEGDFAGDSERVFVRAIDGKIAIVNLRTGEIEGLFADHQEDIIYLDVSRDGKRLAAAGRTKGLVRVWDIATRQVIAEIRAHGGIGVHTVALSHDGKLLATGSTDAITKVWDVATGQLLHTSNHEGWVRSVAFSPDGNILAISNAKEPYPKGALTFLDLRTFQKIAAPDFTVGALCVVFSADGELLAAASRDGRVRVWKVASRKLLRELPTHRGIVWSVAFSPDGKLVASGGQDRALSVCEIETGREIARGYAADEVRAVAFLPDLSTEPKVVSTGFDGTKIWDLKKIGLPTVVGPASGSIHSVTLSPNGMRIATGGGFVMEEWELPAGNRIAFQHKQRLDYWSLDFSPDGNLLAAGGGNTWWDSFIDLREVHTGRLINSLKGHASQVLSQAFSPDGRTLATAGDRTVKLWDVATGQERMSINAHDDILWAVAFSPDSQRLVSGCYDGSAKVWDVTTGNELLKLKAHNYQIYTTKFSPDGKIIATGSADWLVKLWDSATGREIRALKGHFGDVRSVAFSPDGKRMASASHDRTVRIWDIETGLELITLKGHTDFVTSVAFSPDGKLLISGSHDRTVRLWRAAPEAEIKAGGGR